MADVNIYDTVNQLERELRETVQYIELVEAHKAIKADEEAASILAEFQGLQQALFQKQQMGEEISETEALQGKNVSGKMTDNQLTTIVMDKERG